MTTSSVSRAPQFPQPPPLIRLPGALAPETAARPLPRLARPQARLVGDSPAVAAVLDQVTRVATTDASVLIEGESGTGKEIVATVLHELSSRREAPLVPVNCGAIPETLIESELFGHERGSFTGADRAQPGLVERAHGGTLFLDEITEMPLQMQVKLLRVLESGEVQRVGATQPIPIDVRVLAATNRDPKTAIREGRLREDLYFRIAVFPIRLPPLRERRGDVALLAEHFLARLNHVNGTAKRWAASAIEALERREWRGNVRELKNVVDRAFILADDLLQVNADLSPAARIGSFGAADGAGDSVVLRAGVSIAVAERELIHLTLAATGGNKPKAAKLLGISLKTLYNRLNQYKSAPDADPAPASTARDAAP